MEVEVRFFGFGKGFVSLLWVFQDHVPISSFETGTLIQIQGMSFRWSNEPKLGRTPKAYQKGHTSVGRII